MTQLEGELQGKRVLVTGAAGFVGSRLVKRLLDCNAEVFALVDEDRSTDRIDSFKTNGGLHLIHCSLNNTRAISAQRPKWGDIDYVGHLWFEVPDSHDFCEQSIEEINMNLLPTIHLINELGNFIHGICFTSSVSVYGYPAHLPVKESDLPAPITSYGATKLAIENYLRSYGTANKVPVTILRYSTIYGPGEFKHRAIPNFLQSIANGQPPLIIGDGSEIRDYVYIDDVVQATVQAIAGRTNEVLNICSGQGHSTLEVAREIVRLYPVEMSPRFVPSDKKNINFVGDISAAKKSLSYSPQTSLEEGLKKEIDWFKNNKLESTPIENKRHKASRKNNGMLQRLLDYSLLKNIIDRIIAFFGITILSPLLALIMIGIKLDSRGSSIFTQERVGKDGHKFTVYKFRTMHANNDDSKYKAYLYKYVQENAPYRVGHDGQGIYKVDDFHTTKFGTLLRKTNMDEFPQLFNVLKGDMSLVGPRPDIPFAVSMYNDWHRQRLQVKPGITGLWQVCRRKGLSFNDMVHLDIEYINKQSLFLDLKISLLTVGVILKRDGS
jgi:lipopolysaccharide/colanic/teichoic acid biosynthesis glycosyltransferase/nucleoside-diphosphate-sugar epimerase